MPVESLVSSFHERVVIMTAKHVVADDLFGQVTRKQWELNRRVLEGTLDPKRLLQALQQLIEGQSTRLPIEDPGFTVSDQVYAVEVQRKGSFENAARTCLGLEYFSIYHDPPKCWLKVPDGTGPKRVKLCLAQFHINASFNAATIMIENEGYKLADAWDLLAFYKKAPMFRTIPTDEPVIYVFGTTARCYYQDPGSTSGRGHFVSLRTYRKGVAGIQHARWGLSSTCLDWESSACISKGQYALVRCK